MTYLDIIVSERWGPVVQSYFLDIFNEEESIQYKQVVKIKRMSNPDGLINHPDMPNLDIWMYGTRLETVKHFRYIGIHYTCTVDSRYLEVQRTLWNTSIYPYLDISDLQNWGTNKSNCHISQITMSFDPWSKRYNENIVEVSPQYLVEKRRNCSLGAISPLLHNI